MAKGSVAKRGGAVAVRDSRDSLADTALDPVRKVVGWLVALVEVLKTFVRVFLLALPIIGPIGLIAWNLDWKPKASSKSSSGLGIDLSSYMGFWSKTMGQLDNLPLVARVAAAMGMAGIGKDIPEEAKQKAGMAGKFTLPKNLQPPPKSGPGAGPDEPDVQLSADEQEALVQSMTAPAGVKALPAKKLSPTAAEAADLKVALAAIEAAAADYRAFADAASAVAGFSSRYPRAKQRAGLQQRIAELSRLASGALSERMGLTASSKLSSVPLSPAEGRAIQSCLAKIERVRSASLVRKETEQQMTIPAYFVLLDLQTAPVRVANAGAALPPPAEIDAGERLAFAHAANACFSARRKAGSLAVLYWSDAGVQVIAPAFVAASDALVFVR